MPASSRRAKLRALGDPVEPFGLDVRVKGVGPVSVIAGVFGALPPYRYSQRELTDSFVSIPDFEGGKTPKKDKTVSGKTLFDDAADATTKAVAEQKCDGKSCSQNPQRATGIPNNGTITLQSNGKKDKHCQTYVFF